MSTQGDDPRGATGTVTSTVSWGRAPGWRDDFEDFYRAELPRLVALAHALCESGTADDVAQEAMLAAYRRWKQVRDQHRPDAWVRRRCVRLALSGPRLRLVPLRRSLRLTIRSGGPSPLEAADEGFWRQVRDLPSRQAAAVALHQVLGLDEDDVATTLGVPPADVRSDLATAYAGIDAALLRVEAARLHASARSVPVGRSFEDLVETRRRRTAGRVVAVLVVVALVAGAVVLADGSGSDDPQPVDPQRVGAVVTNLRGLSGEQGRGTIRVDIDGRSDILSELPDGTPLVDPVDLEMSPEGDVLALVDGDSLQVVGLGKNHTATSVPCDQCLFVDWMGYKVGILLVTSLSADDGALHTQVYDTAGQARGALRLPEGITASGYAPDRLHMVGVEELGKDDTRRSRLFLLDDGTGKRTPLEGTETSPGHVIDEVAWSPDGVQVGYIETDGDHADGTAVRDHRLMVAFADGSGARQVADLGRCSCLRIADPRFAWSPDGSSLLAVAVSAHDDSETSEVRVFGLDGTVERTLSGGAPVDWGPDPP